MGLVETATVGRIMQPPRIGIHGNDKIGKTTFAAGAPSPFFLQCEQGADETGCARTPLLATFAEYCRWTAALIAEPHEHRTVVVDSLDALDALVRAHVCRERGWTSIETPGYGKGYIELERPWRTVLADLDVLRAHRKMAIVVIGHSEIKRFDSPETEPYDRVQVALHKSVLPLVSRWLDVLGYACEEAHVSKTDVGFDKKVRRAIGGGRRVLRLVGAPAYQAGNRYGLPRQIALDWDELVRAFAKRHADDGVAAKEIEKMMEEGAKTQQ